MHEVTSAALELDKDPAVKAIILTGEGPKVMACCPPFPTGTALSLACAVPLV